MIVPYGSNYFVFWADAPPDAPPCDGRTDVYAARVTPAGQVLDVGGVPVLTDQTVGEAPVSAASDGTNFLLISGRLSSQSTSIARPYKAVLVSASGAVLGSPIPLPDSIDAAAVAFDGTNYLIVSVSVFGIEPPLTAMRVSTSGTILDNPPRQLNPPRPDGGDALFPNAEPVVAFNGTEYLAVWGESSSNYANNYRGVRISKTGVVLDSPPIAFGVGRPSIGAGFYVGGAPTVASDGSNFFVVWKELSSTNAGVFGRRMDAAGNVLGAAPTQLVTGVSFYPSIAFDGAGYRLVWQDSEVP